MTLPGVPSLDDHRKALLALKDGSSEVVARVEEYLDQFRRTDYVAFCKLHIALLVNASDHFTSELASLLLLKESREKNLFASVEVFSQLWHEFTEHIPVILANPNLPVPVRKNITSMLANVCANFSRISKTDEVQQFVLSLMQNPSLEFFVYLCVTEVLEQTSDFAGFDPATIRDLLSRECLIGESSLVRFRLYLAIAGMNVEGALEFLPSMLASFPSDFALKCLRMLDSFCRSHGSVFAETLSLITDFLVSIIENCDNSNEMRNTAMYCLDSLAEGAKDACMASESFCMHSLVSLLKVATEVTDDSVCEFDANEMRPAFVALDVMSCLTENCPSKQFIDFAESLIQDAVNQSWQAVSALLLAVSEFDSLCFRDLFYVNNGRLVTWNSFAMACLDKPPPLLRLAAWKAIGTFSKYLPNIFQKTTAKELIVCFENGALQERDTRVRRELLATFASFFYEGLLPFQATDESQSAYERACVLNMRLLNELVDPLELKLVVTASAFFIRTLPDGNQLLPNIAQRLVTIFDAFPNENDLRIAVLYTLSKSAHYTNRIPLDLSKKVLIEAWELFGKCTNESSQKKCQVIILSLIEILESQASAIFVPAFEFAIRQSIQSVGIERFTKYDESQFATRDLYLCVPWADDGTSVYVSKGDVHDIQLGLTFLVSLCDGIGVEILAKLREISAVVLHWLTNSARISKLMRPSWKILTRVITLATKHNTECLASRQGEIIDITELFLLAFDSFCETLDRVDAKLDGEMLKSMFVILSRARTMQWCDQSRLVRVIESISSHADTMFAKIEETRSYVAENLQGDESEETMLTRQQNAAILSIVDIWKLLFISYSEIAGPYFGQYMYAKCHEKYLCSVVAQGFGCQLLAYYLSQSKSPVNQVAQTLSAILAIGTDKRLATGTEFLKANSIAALQSTSIIITKYSFPPEIVRAMFTQLVAFCRDDDLLVDSTSVSDMALFALTTLLRRNSKVLAMPNTVSTWFSCFPVWKPCEIYTNRIFAYLADLLEHRHPELFQPERIEQWISYACQALGCRFMSRETEARFFKLFKDLLASDMREIAENAISQLNPLVRAKIEQNLRE